MEIYIWKRSKKTRKEQLEANKTTSWKKKKETNKAEKLDFLITGR